MSVRPPRTPEGPRRHVGARSRTLAVAVAVLGGALATIPAPAQAAEPWVTRAEYRAVSKGMAKARVHAIFDFTGVLVIPAGGGHPYESRHFRTRWDGVAKCIAIDYQRRDGVWRVVSKSTPWRDAPGGGCRY